jgi:hypothetical protein
MSLILILENRDHMFRYKIKIYNKLNYKIKQKTTSVSNFVSLVNVRLYLFRDGSVFESRSTPLPYPPFHSSSSMDE